MLNEKDINYFNYGKVENIKFWKRLGGKPNLNNKSILDFGCGHGSLCIDMANSGPKSIDGIDLDESLLNFAKLNLEKNFNQYKNLIRFYKKDLIKDNFDQQFDLIVSKDTFEHTIDLPKILEKFQSLLKKGGKAYIGFGPLYNFYNGDHGGTQLRFPWMHVILSEKFIIRRFNKNNKEQIRQIEDLGLSKYSFAEYEKIFKFSDLEIEFYITNQSDNPISIIFNLLSKISFLREYCTYNIYCILKKN